MIPVVLTGSPIKCYTRIWNIITTIDIYSNDKNRSNDNTVFVAATTQHFIKKEEKTYIIKLFTKSSFKELNF